ncbi:Gastrula zinc finger protein XlCGF26.1-like 1 [Homarus americanus]|uniref:Gastrula zinc finger protein XlCGF26.1-like 1 n=1 Tax=Homarus americanus TaxID=6706 RepID=A0A8J5MVJ8_HOMAM|nr:Gastrula zinc finger protein XlCGF26.1-like 1 [Homarus americanus]
MNGVMVQPKDILGLSSFQDNMGRVPGGSLSHRMSAFTSNITEGGGWGSAVKCNYGINWGDTRVNTENVVKDDRPFPCPYCPLSFKRRYTLQEHVRIHIGARPYACRSCGKTFTQRSSLLKHVRVRVCQKHSGGDSLLGTRRNLKRDPDLCPPAILGLGSHLTPNLLRVDTTTVAAGSMYHALVDAAGSCITGGRTDVKSRVSVNPLGASVRSDYKSSSLNPLAAAAGLDDSVERPYPCHFCDARFKKKQHLQNHERIHTGEKYVCTLCGQAFSRMHILKHHLERKHTDPSNTVYHLDP